MDLTHQVQLVNSKESLVQFIEALRVDLEAHPDQWENLTLEGYLDAVQAWIGSMDQAYKNSGKDPVEAPSWETVAAILHAGKFYE